MTRKRRGFGRGGDKEENELYAFYTRTQEFGIDAGKGVGWVSIHGME